MEGELEQERFWIMMAMHPSFFSLKLKLMLSSKNYSSLNSRDIASANFQRCFPLVLSRWGCYFFKETLSLQGDQFLSSFTNESDNRKLFSSTQACRPPVLTCHIAFVSKEGWGVGCYTSFLCVLSLLPAFFSPSGAP